MPEGRRALRGSERRQCRCARAAPGEVHPRSRCRVRRAGRSGGRRRSPRAQLARVRRPRRLPARARIVHATLWATIFVWPTPSNASSRLRVPSTRMRALSRESSGRFSSSSGRSVSSCSSTSGENARTALVRPGDRRRRRRSVERRRQPAGRLSRPTSSLRRRCGRRQPVVVPGDYLGHRMHPRKRCDCELVIALPFSGRRADTAWSRRETN